MMRFFNKLNQSFCRTSRQLKKQLFVVYDNCSFFFLLIYKLISRFFIKVKQYIKRFSLNFNLSLVFCMSPAIKIMFPLAFLFCASSIIASNVSFSETIPVHHVRSVVRPFHFLFWEFNPVLPNLVLDTPSMLIGHYIPPEPKELCLHFVRLNPEPKYFTVFGDTLLQAYLPKRYPLMGEFQNTWTVKSLEMHFPRECRIIKKYAQAFYNKRHPIIELN